MESQRGGSDHHDRLTYTTNNFELGGWEALSGLSNAAEFSDRTVGSGQGSLDDGRERSHTGFGNIAVRDTPGLAYDNIVLSGSSRAVLGDVHPFDDLTGAGAWTGDELPDIPVPRRFMSYAQHVDLIWDDIAQLSGGYSHRKRHSNQVTQIPPPRLQSIGPPNVGGSQTTSGGANSGSNGLNPDGQQWKCCRTWHPDTYMNNIQISCTSCQHMKCLNCV